MIKTPDGDWINPEAVAAIVVDHVGVSFMAATGAALFHTSKDTHDEALAFAEVMAEAINKAT